MHFDFFLSIQVCKSICVFSLQVWTFEIDSNGETMPGGNNMKKLVSSFFYFFQTNENLMAGAQGVRFDYANQ
jgi:hypothetical protein